MNGEDKEIKTEGMRCGVCEGKDCSIKDRRRCETYADLRDEIRFDLVERGLK